MFHFEGLCPHCGSDKGFQAMGSSDFVIGEYDYSKTPQADRVILAQRRENNPLAKFSLCGTCHTCKSPVVATCEASKNAYAEIISCISSNQTTPKRAEVKRLYPEPTPPYSHASLPDEVRAAFIDLQNMLRQKMQPYLIISGCRTVLEAAVKVLGGNGKTLKDRIDNVRTQGIITEVLHDWASHIRFSGNDAVHEMKGTPADASELVEFTKVFLQFTFELPARIAAVRKATTP